MRRCRVLGLRGYVKLVQLPVGRAPAETAKLLSAQCRPQKEPMRRRLSWLPFNGFRLLIAARLPGRLSMTRQLPPTKSQPRRWSDRSRHSVEANRLEVLKEFHMRRREFLKSAAAPLIVPASALDLTERLRRATRSRSRPHRCRRDGQRAHSRLRTASDVRNTIPICDVRRQHRERAKQIIDSKYGNSDCALYNDSVRSSRGLDIDAIVMACPDFWHALVGSRSGPESQGHVLRKAAQHEYRGEPGDSGRCEAVRRRVSVGHTTALRCRLPICVRAGPERQARETAERHDWNSDGFVLSGCSAGGRARWLRLRHVAGRHPGFLQHAAVTRNWTLIRDYSLGCLSGAWGIHDVDIRNGR